MKIETKQSIVCYSHRGDKTYYPENTDPAYTKAVLDGFTGLELDVVASKDGTIFCSHNHDLERETNGFGYFFEKTTFEIETYHAVNPVSTRAERIPKLEDILERYSEVPNLNIEIKFRKIFDVSIAIKVARIITKHKMEKNILVSSFNPIVLRIVKVINSKIKTGYLIESLGAILFLSLARPNYIHPRADILCEGLIAYAKKRRKKLNVWTVNTRPAANHIIKYNVAGIITDKEEICATLT